MPKQDALKTCFVISPIGDEGSDIRDRSDEILDYIIKPVAQKCGYENIVRADQISKPGMITSDIVQHLLDDDLVVADLTGHNPNVFYELAVRHAKRKPVVQIIRADQDPPFDVLQSRTIKFDERSPRSVEECKQKLEAQIREVENDPACADNPISQAIDLWSLRQSDNPVEKSNAEIMAMLRELLSRVAGIRAMSPSANADMLRQITDTAARNVLDEIDRSLR